MPHFFHFDFDRFLVSPFAGKKHNMVEGYNDRLNDFISRMVEQPIYVNNERLVNEKVD